MAAGSIPQRFTRENPTCNAFLTPGKIEARLREIEKFKGDDRIAAFRIAEDAKAQLTAEQREKLKSLRPMRGAPGRGRRGRRSRVGRGFVGRGSRRRHERSPRALADAGGFIGKFEVRVSLPQSSRNKRAP